MVLKYYTQDNRLDSRSNSQSASGSITSSTKKLKFRGGVSETNGSNQLSVHGEDVQSVAITNASTTVSSKNRIFDEKFKFVKDSNKPDSSLRYFSFLLNILLVGFIIIFSVGIIIVNQFPSPSSYYTFMESLAELNVKSNELVFAARYLLLQQDESVNYGPCSFNPENNTYPICPWVEKAENGSGKTTHALKEYIHEVDVGLIDTFNNFQAFYMKMRIPGDELDIQILGKFQVGQFVNGSAEEITMFEVATLWSAFSLYIGAGEIVDSEFDVKKSERYWNLILANRNIFNTLNLKLAGLIPDVSSRILSQLALAHLILAIITIAVALV